MKVFMKPQRKIHCAGCMQDVIRDCPEALIAAGHYPCLVVTLRRFADAAQRVGIDTSTLIRLLNAGVPIPRILDLIEVRIRRKAETAQATN
jgi:hypothetical protein